MDEPDAVMKEAMDKAFNTMEDNTQVNDEEKKLKFAKLSMPASVIDFLMEHYGFFDLVEVQQLSLYIMKSLALMEKDGCKLAVYKPEKGLDGKDAYGVFELDIHDLIAKFRIGLAGSIKDKKLYEPDIKIEERERNEKDSV